VCGCLRA
jgi:hypothetical protein